MKDLMPSSYRAVINGLLAIFFLYLFGSKFPDYYFITILLMLVVVGLVFAKISKVEKFSAFSLFPKWVVLVFILLISIVSCLIYL